MTWQTAEQVRGDFAEHTKGCADCDKAPNGTVIAFCPKACEISERYFQAKQREANARS